MTNEPLITVLMPVYNCAGFLREAIDSVLSQTCGDFEFLIINDGSTDASESIILSYADARIRLVNQANGGVSNALNKGLGIARGKYIARFDADDICYPNRLAEQLAFMESHPDYVMVGSDADYVSEEGEFIFSYENTGHTHEEISERMHQRNPLIHSAVFFLTTVIIQAGCYDLGAHTFEDHLLWVKVIKMGKVCNLKKALIKVRLNSASVTTDERLRGKRFLELRQSILDRGDFVREEEARELQAIIKQQAGNHTKVLGYHLFVAKKYLWNNYRPLLARGHVWQAMKLKPFSPDVWVLFFLSFMPKVVVVKLYEMLK